jgi:hypothetical protein
MNMDVVEDDDAQQRQRAAQQKIVFARLAYSRQVFEASLVRAPGGGGGQEGGKG